MPDTALRTQLLDTPNRMINYVNRYKSGSGGGDVAPPAFVSAGSKFDSYTSLTSLQPGVPAGYQSGDIFVAKLVVYGDQSSEGWPSVSGWTRFSEGFGSIGSHALYWRRVTASESTPVFDIGVNAASNAALASVSAYRGCVSTGSPIGVLEYTSLYTNTPYAPAIVPQVDGGLLVGLLCCGTRHSWTTSPPPSGWSLAVDESTSAGSDCRITEIYRDEPTEKDVAQGNVTIGTLSAGKSRNLISFVLKPS